MHSLFLASVLCFHVSCIFGANLIQTDDSSCSALQVFRNSNFQKLKSSFQIFESTSLSCVTCGNIQQVPFMKSAGGCILSCRFFSFCIFSVNSCACPQNKKKSIDVVQGTQIVSCVECPPYIFTTSNTSVPISVPQEVSLSLNFHSTRQQQASVVDPTICLPCFGKTGLQNYTIPTNFTFSKLWEPATYNPVTKQCGCSLPGFVLSQ